MKFIFLALGAVILSACSLWGIFEGKIAHNNWEIQKIVVDGKEYLSPQLLRAQALQNQTLQNQALQNQALQNNIEGETKAQISQNTHTTPQNPDTTQDTTKENSPNGEAHTGEVHTDGTLAQENGSVSQESPIAPSTMATPAQNTALPQSTQTPQTTQTQDSKEHLLDLKEIATMNFDPSEHRIYGVTGCNNYFASYAWKDSDHLEVGNTGMTRKLCEPDTLMSFEFRLMRNFNGIFSVKRNGTSMVLDNGKMQIYLQ
ncbi:hypothetical protein BKH46_08495 [Helicobacter sp. 12S02634-8]|uniref:META domain-containing protein n=1 Tax=Helicobacter sp. 12S02634-8 TaxID=1476199 RepID=UPI000BA60764|nr:META domain-containing protein [Helicobacter sp. 12S02634-8]PAF46208.1 hypothetical protein BKH46_08495 [Helicobacter sp. 12S02634-8]